MAKYNEDEIRIAVEMAGDIGIAATKRELGYPSSWHTLKTWCDNAGVEIALDELKSKAAKFNEFYNDTEQIIANQELIARSRELMDNPNLTPVELDKLANVVKKATEMIRTIQGKANAYKPAEEDKTDIEALKLYDEWKNGAGNE